MLGVFPVLSEHGPWSPLRLTSHTVSLLPIPPPSSHSAFQATPTPLSLSYHRTLAPARSPPCKASQLLNLAKLPLILQSSSYKKHPFLKGAFLSCSDWAGLSYSFQRPCSCSFRALIFICKEMWGVFFFLGWGLPTGLWAPQSRDGLDPETRIGVQMMV